VAGLVLLAPVTHPWPGGVAWYYGPTLFPGLGYVFSHVIMPPVASLVINSAADTVFLPQKAPPGYIERTGARMVLRPSEFRANAEDVYDLHAFVTAQATRYSAIKAPTVIISGDADDVVWTRLHSASLAREVPGAKLIVLSGLGHMVHHMAADTIIAEIRALSALQIFEEPLQKL
jgi:pimeloyl-ACP methyl ester carboxylesterase